MKRFLATLALVLPLLEPAARALRAAGAGEHACEGHVCLCARRCPPRRAAPEDCHGEAPSTGVRGSCNHDFAAGLPLVTAAALPPAMPSPSRWTASALPPSRIAPTLPGVARLDLPPPRAI